MRAPTLIVALLGLTACDDYLFGVATNEPTELPSESGFAGVEQVVDAHCLGCHSPPQPLGGLDLETDLYGATVNVVGQYGLPIVFPNDPESSMFYLKLANQNPPNTGTDMPPGSGGLSPTLAAIVQDWILAGAPDGSGQLPSDDTGATP